MPLTLSQTCSDEFELLRASLRTTPEDPINSSGPSSTKVKKEGPDLILPLPGLCVLVKAKGYQDYQTVKRDVFINVTHHESVKPAVTKRACNHSHGSGHHKQPELAKHCRNFWEIPYSVADVEKGMRNVVIC